MNPVCRSSSAENAKGKSNENIGWLASLHAQAALELRQKNRTLHCCAIKSLDTPKNNSQGNDVSARTGEGDKSAAHRRIKT